MSPLRGFESQRYVFFYKNDTPSGLFWKINKNTFVMND